VAVPAARVIVTATGGGCAGAGDVCHNVVSSWGGLTKEHFYLLGAKFLPWSPLQRPFENPGQLLPAFSGSDESMYALLHGPSDTA
jgi:hypothetical protein